MVLGVNDISVSLILQQSINIPRGIMIVYMTIITTEVAAYAAAATPLKGGDFSRCRDSAKVCGFGWLVPSSLLAWIHSPTCHIFAATLLGIEVEVHIEAIEMG